MLQRPSHVIVLLAAMLLLVLVLAARWRVLLFSQGYYCSFRNVLALTFVAIFFDSLLPGGTSDIVRGYLFDRTFQPHDRVRAASTKTSSNIAANSTMTWLGRCSTSHSRDNPRRWVRAR